MRCSPKSRYTRWFTSASSSRTSAPPPTAATIRRTNASSSDCWTTLAFLNASATARSGATSIAGTWFGATIASVSVLWTLIRRRNADSERSRSSRAPSTEARAFNSASSLASRSFSPIFPTS